jgi:hypothetical protein
VIEISRKKMAIMACVMWILICIAGYAALDNSKKANEISILKVKIEKIEKQKNLGDLRNEKPRENNIKGDKQK